MESEITAEMNTGVENLSPWTKANPLYKPITIQILIFSSWLVGTGFLMYYTMYVQLKYTLIDFGIMPEPVSWMLYVSIILIIIGLGLLATPLDSSYFVRKDLENMKDDLLEKIDTFLEKGDYNQAKQEIEDYLDTINDHRLNVEKEPFLKKMREIEILKIVQENYHQIHSFLDQNQAEKAKRQFLNFNGFINHHLNRIPAEIIQNFDELYLKIQDKVQY